MIFVIGPVTVIFVQSRLVVVVFFFFKGASINQAICKALPSIGRGGLTCF